MTSHPARWTTRAALGAVAVAWVVIAFVVLSPEMPSYGDWGVKFIEAHALIQSGFRSLVMPFPAIVIDGRYEFFPFMPPFVVPTPSGIQGIFPPFPAILRALIIWAWGPAGVAALSVLGGLATLWLSLRIVPLRAGWLLPLALGCGTCLWFYSTVPWEHTPAIALTMAAFYVAYRGEVRRAWTVGLLLGVGATLRPESLLLTPGLLLVLFVRWRRLGPLASALVPAGIVIAANAALDPWYGRPVAAHAAHAVGFLRQIIESAGGSSVSDIRALDPMTFGDRYNTVVHYWLIGDVSGVAVGLSVAALVASAYLFFRRQSVAGVLCVSVVACAWAVYDAVSVMLQPRWLTGLVTLSPFLLFAALPAPGASDDDRRWRRLALAASAMFACGALLTSDASSGKSFGPRFLLPIVPLLAIAAWQGIMAFWDTRRERPAHGVIAWCGFATVAASIVISLICALPSYARRNQAAADAYEAIRRSPDRMIVAGDPAVAQLLAPVYFKKFMLLANNKTECRDIGRLVSRAGLPTLLLVLRGEHPDYVPETYRLISTETYGGLRVERWSR